MRLPIPAERPSVGPMKPVASARTTQSILKSGQLELTIEHDTVRRVTPTMLRWWFENLGQHMTFEGRTYPRYLLWHPRDHIHWELAAMSPTGGSGQGAYFRIVEAQQILPTTLTQRSGSRSSVKKESLSSGA